MDLDKLNSGMPLSMIKIEKQDELNIEKNINKNKSNIIIPVDYKNSWRNMMKIKMIKFNH